MHDLIDRQTAIEEISKARGVGKKLYDSIVDIIETIPAAEGSAPVIVTCGECKNYIKEHKCCKLAHGLLEASEEKFCSYAEGK